jgi:hypothetical protein
LKTLWLSGHPTGATGAAELLDQRHLVGDLVTAVMELAAMALVLALTYSWGRRLPATVVLTPVWIATGLLTPIALGLPLLPLGLLAQTFAGGTPAPADNGLQGWVFPVVYGGFIVQAATVLVAFVGYAQDRRPWPSPRYIRATKPNLHSVATPLINAVRVAPNSGASLRARQRPHRTRGLHPDRTGGGGEAALAHA